MLQAHVLNVLSVFSDVCCKCVYLDVAYVFTHMMQVFYLDVVHVYNGFKCFQVFLQVFSDACFKCFICFQSYVAIVALGFKSRSSVCISLLAFLLSHLSIRHRKMEAVPTSAGGPESPSLVLVINDTKVLMPCVKCFS
jgi:hypothetical protein